MARATGEAAALRARLDTAADDYADGKIVARQLERITARIRPALDAAENRARVVDDYPLLEGLVGNDKAADVWAGLPLTRRRAVIDLLVTVTVQQTAPGTREFDPEQVQIVGEIFPLMATGSARLGFASYMEASPEGGRRPKPSFTAVIWRFSGIGRLSPA